MAPPLKPINPEQVRKLAGIGCTTAEIGSILGCSDDTLERRFAGALKKGRAKLCMTLRRKQVRIAMGGNVAMLIWLGKQLLGQADRQDVTTTNMQKLYEDPRVAYAVAKTANSRTACGDSDGASQGI